MSCSVNEATDLLSASTEDNVGLEEAEQSTSLSNEQALPFASEPHESNRHDQTVGETADFKFSLQGCRVALLSRENRRTAKELLQLAWPVALALAINNLMSFQTLIFCGHAPSPNGENGTQLILDAAALAVSFSNTTGLSILIGMATACDTLFSQSYGSRNKRALGIIFQQSLGILGLACFVIAAVWVNGTPLLRLLGQDSDVAREAGIYTTILSAALPGYALNLLLTRYLQVQGITTPSIYFSLAGNATLALLDYILVIFLKLGIRGAALGYAVATTVQPVLVVFYVHRRGLHHKTWPGWSWQALNKWAVFGRLAFAGTVMMCLEWWAVETVVFISGLLGKVELAVMAIMFQILFVAGMVTVGMSIATAITTGNHLGAGNWQAAKRAARVALFLNVLLALLMAIVFSTSQTVIGRIFTSDSAVVDGVAELMPILAATTVADYIQTLLQGVIRGSGRQKIGAVVNLIAFYVIALPSAIPLALMTSLRLKGLWLGLSSALVFQDVVYFIVVMSTKWKLESFKAQARVASASGKDSERPVDADRTEDIELSEQVNRNNCHRLDDHNSPVGTEFLTTDLNPLVDGNNDDCGDDKTSLLVALTVVQRRHLLAQKSLLYLVAIGVFCCGMLARMSWSTDQSNTFELVNGTDLTNG